MKQYADISILYQLAKELSLNYLLGKNHKPITALLIVHLLCKCSVLKMGKWIEQSTVKEIISLDQLTKEKLYRSLDYLEECDFELLEQSIYEYWQKLCPKDNESFVLDATDTYYNGKHDESTPHKGNEGRVSKLRQIVLAVSFENCCPIFHKVYNGSISNIKVLEDMMRIMAQRCI